MSDDPDERFNNSFEAEEEVQYVKLWDLVEGKRTDPIMRGVTIENRTYIVTVPNTINNSRHPYPTINVAVIMPYQSYDDLVDAAEENWEYDESGELRTIVALRQNVRRRDEDIQELQKVIKQKDEEIEDLNDRIRFDYKPARGDDE